jgi:hypothetical protein
LEITARFPEGSVRIRQFEGLTDALAQPAEASAAYTRGAGSTRLVHERRPPLEPGVEPGPSDAPPAADVPPKE